MALNQVEKLAKQADISVTTVRRALRGDHRVRPSTVKHVRELARQTGYRPNSAARALASQRPTNVGFVPMTPCSEADAEEAAIVIMRRAIPFIVRLTDELESRGMNLMQAPAHRILKAEQYGVSLPRIVKEGHADMLVVYSHMTPSVADRLRLMQVPAIVVDGPDCGLPAVQVDESKAVEHLVDYLVGRGHRRIAFMSHNVSPEGTVSGYRDVLWPRGYFKAMTRHQLLPVPGWDQFIVSVEKTVDALLKLHDAPSAIIAYDDQQANLVVHYLLSRGIRVPEDMAVVAVCSRGIGMIVSPTITHQHSPYAAMAKAVGQMFETFRSTGELKVEKFVLPAEFIEGQTSWAR